ncbi:MAG: hypothetical protein PHH83_04360 [Patescibacteria group bacterium]|nr:hypothetical protein [Patescibacteria group bacterium]
MKNIFIMVLTISLFVVFSCSEKPSQVRLSDQNEDANFHVPASSGLLGNVDLHVIPETIQGSAIILINGPGVSIGYDIRDKDDNSFIYFADSYISAGGNTIETGTIIPYNKWIHIRLVIYESGLSGYVVSFLELLGLDFFDSLEDYMIDSIYEADFMFEGPSSVKKTQWIKLKQQKSLSSLTR